MTAVGKTPSILAEDIKRLLSQYIQQPIVSVIVNNFAGTFSQQVRIVGATAKTASLPYRANMTLLDAMISVDGLSEYAAGTKDLMVRFHKATGKQTDYTLSIADVHQKVETKANVSLEQDTFILCRGAKF